jgi:hypothetical protein
MIWTLQFYQYDVAQWLKGDKVPLGKLGNPGAIRDGAIPTITTSSLCRTNGSTPGMRRGTSLFIA